MYMQRQKQKIQAEANAENTSGPHEESPHVGGRRPPHIMWPTSTFSICLPLYFLLWPHIVLYVCADWGPKSMFFQPPCTLSAGVVPTIHLQQTARGRIWLHIQHDLQISFNQLIAFRPKVSWSGDRGLQIGLISLIIWNILTGFCSVC